MFCVCGDRTPRCPTTSFLLPTGPCLHTSHGMPVSPKRENKMRLSHAASTPMREHLLLLSPLVIRSNMPVPLKRENKRPFAMLIGTVTNPFPSRRQLCFLCHVLLNPSPVGKAPSTTPSVTSCTTSTASACGRFHAVILQQARDHVPHVWDLFYTYTDGKDLVVLLNTDTFVSGGAVFSISDTSTSKDTWRMVALVVRGLLRRPSVADPPTVTPCSLHIHDKVAKKT